MKLLRGGSREETAPERSSESPPELSRWSGGEQRAGRRVSAEMRRAPVEVGDEVGEPEARGRALATIGSVARWKGELHLFGELAQPSTAEPPLLAESA